MQGCFENPFVNDTSLDPRPLPSLHMRTRYSALSTDYLNNVFSKNNYNTDFVRRNTHSNTDPNTQTTATIPYIRGTSETIAQSSITTLQYMCCTQNDNHFTATAY